MNFVTIDVLIPPKKEEINRNIDSNKVHEKKKIIALRKKNVDGTKKKKKKHQEGPAATPCLCHSDGKPFFKNQIMNFG